MIKNIKIFYLWTKDQLVKMMVLNGRGQSKIGRGDILRGSSKKGKIKWKRVD